MKNFEFLKREVGWVMPNSGTARFFSNEIARLEGDIAKLRQLLAVDNVGHEVEVVERVMGSEAGRWMLTYNAMLGEIPIDLLLRDGPGERAAVVAALERAYHGVAY